MIKITAFDPSFRNFGIVKARIDDAGAIHSLEIEDMYLVTTEGRTGKEVRKNSDNLRRGSELHQAMLKAVEDAHVVISEIPQGSQSAAAAAQLGIVTGILATCPKKIVQVQPVEAKVAFCGKKAASKKEMIERGVQLFPDAPWLRRKHKGEMRLTDANEHLADAVASIFAGVQTDQFYQLMELMRAFRSQQPALYNQATSN